MFYYMKNIPQTDEMNVTPDMSDIVTVRSDSGNMEDMRRPVTMATTPRGVRCHGSAARPAVRTHNTRAASGRSQTRSVRQKSSPPVILQGC